MFRSSRWTALVVSVASLSSGCASSGQSAPREPATDSAQADSESAGPTPADSTSQASPSDGDASPKGEPTGDGASEQDWSRVGTVTDGATLTSAEAVNGPGAAGATLVLGFDGKGPPPATRARFENPRLVTIVVEGVRGVKANLPVVTGEGFRVIGKPRVIDRGPVKSIGRGFYGDDSGIRIDVELSVPATLDLREGTTGRTVELRLTPTS
ncbi:MAG TPA: hypothetical protein VLC09_18820 [Polyangiaceae bacterium]|nr:hypothetical protein [Polyangiaceae bacterium]